MTKTRNPRRAAGTAPAPALAAPIPEAAGGAEADTDLPTGSGLLPVKEYQEALDRLHLGHLLDPYLAAPEPAPPAVDRSRLPGDPPATWRGWQPDYQPGTAMPAPAPVAEPLIALPALPPLPQMPAMPKLKLGPGYLLGLVVAAGLLVLGGIGWLFSGHDQQAALPPYLPPTPPAQQARVVPTATRPPAGGPAIQLPDPPTFEVPALAVPTEAPIPDLPAELPVPPAPPTTVPTVAPRPTSPPTWTAIPYQRWDPLPQQEIAQADPPTATPIPPPAPVPTSPPAPVVAAAPATPDPAKQNGNDYSPSIWGRAAEIHQPTPEPTHGPPAGW